tara:strand:+ start:190 stop:591 length:402 start_codon:yes stop_codon:yes gene_type:complete
MMKNKKYSIAAVVAGTLLIAVVLTRADDQKPGSAKTRDGDEQVHPYPLKTCVVSGEALESMGKPRGLIFKQEMKFCCKSCVKDFNKDPLKYVAKLAAEAQKQKGATSPAHSKGGVQKEGSSHKKADDHSGHDH